MHWYRSARLARATYAVAGDGPPEFTKSSCLGITLQPTLTSSRLTLRPYSAADAAEVRRLAGDRRIADTTTSIPHPYPECAAEAWIALHPASFAARKEVTFAVTVASGELLGTASLLDLSAAHARAELGYWIGFEFWGRGYCTEAVSRLVEFAQQDLDITRIIARCLARNTASARVMEKVGLKREWHLVKHTLKNGVYEDVLLYGCVMEGRR